MEGTAQLSFERRSPLLTETYVVKRGDTVYSLLKRLGKKAPSLEELRAMNPHLPNLNRIFPGQRINLRKVFPKPMKTQDYRVKKGDTITGIILYELKAPPQDVVRLLREIRKLNPHVENFNRLSPGQILKIPALLPEEGRETKGEHLDRDNLWAFLRQFLQFIGSNLIDKGSYFIPLPGQGQVTLDCALTPVVELRDGTTVFLDPSATLPESLSNLITATWENYRFYRKTIKDPLSLLQDILRSSQNYRLERVTAPLILTEEPLVELMPSWLLKESGPKGEVKNSWAVFEASSLRIPSPLVVLARKRGINIIEVVRGKVIERQEGWTKREAPLLIGGDTSENFLREVLKLLDLSYEERREVRLFEVATDGFDLTLEAPFWIRMGSKAVFIHKNKLPEQFKSLLAKKGITTFHLAEGLPRRKILEGLFQCLDAPGRFGYYVFPKEKGTFRIALFALQVERSGETWYLVDYPLSDEVSGFLMEEAKIKLLQY